MSKLPFRLVILTTLLAACGGDNGVEDASMDGMSDAIVADPGIVVNPTLGLQTSEAGATAEFQVVLRSQPNAAVTIPITSGDVTEGTVGTDSLEFTVDNWNAPQTVTVTGVDDADADGPIDYTITVGPAVSDDGGYSGLTGADVAITNIDDETAGITVDPTSGLTTTEMGGTATFTVVLNAPPSADVTIALSTSDDTEGTVSPSSLTFTAESFGAPQTVTVTGVDDAEADGTIAYTIVTAPATSADTSYDEFDASDVAVENLDDESPGILVEPTDGLMTTEAGGDDTFTVVLLTAPTADVTIPISSSNTGEGTTSVTELVFTSDNFNAPQTVTVTGVDDALADGNQIYMAITGAATSADADYMGLDGSDVLVTNVDDETAGVTVEPLAGLVTTEAGGSAAFTVVLNSMPTADVSIPVVSANPDEGTASPGTLMFTSLNWNAPQTVTVTGVDDLVADGDQPYTVQLLAATSADVDYDALDASDVSLTNTDDETAGITVGAISGDTGEDGTAATFTVVLNSEPTADVTIALSSSDTGEGTIAPASLTFTPLNWNALRIVTVTGVDDAIADGNQPYTALLAPAVSADPDYMALDATDVGVINIDDDSAGITVSPTTGLVTNESGGIDTFSIVLNSQPTADVTISVASEDPTEVTASAASFTFTPANWDAPQIITVTGVDDPVADGDQLIRILTGAATSADGDYDGIDPANVEVTNVDNDSPGITVNPTTGVVTTEAGGTDTFEVVLNSQPSGDVTIGLSSDNTDEGTVAPASLTFTMANWNSPQTVTVTGVDDLVADGSQIYRILTAAAVSTDPQYDTIDAADVEVSNTDDDSPGITVTLADGISDEGGDTAAIRLVLNSQPTADVVIAPLSADSTEGVVDVVDVTFTPANWNAPQTFTVTGQDDDVQDGNQNYPIDFTVTSTDGGYDGFAIPQQILNNVDDDSAGVTITVPDGITNETGTDTGLVTIVLQSEPVSDVTINLTSTVPGEGVPRAASITFTPMNWDSPRDVIIDGVDDNLADGLQRYRINYSVTSTDANYAPLTGTTPVELDNLDDDSPSVQVTVSDAFSGEDGSTATLSVVLGSEPFTDVTIDFVSNDGTEGDVDPTTQSLTFTPANWDSAQPVTIIGEDDAVEDGDQNYAIDWSVSAGDAGYMPLFGTSGILTNVDDDSAGITISVIDDRSGENQVLVDTAEFTVVLNSEPVSPVTFTFTSSDGTEVASPASIMFDATDWDSPKTVQLPGLDDDLADGDQPYRISYAITGDPLYDVLPDGLVPPAGDPAFRNLDDDSPGVVLTVNDAITNEDGVDTGEIELVLLSEPFQPVTINLASNRPDEGAPADPAVTFLPADWDTPQTVTIDGVDDFIADGPQTYRINYTVSSADPAYMALPGGASTLLTNEDDDTAGLNVVIVRAESTEAGGAALVDVNLTSLPSANVTLSLSVSDPSEGAVLAPNPIVIGPTTFGTPRRIQVQGLDDAVMDGDITHQLTITVSSPDPLYNMLPPEIIDITNLDDEGGPRDCYEVKFRNPAATSGRYVVDLDGTGPLAAVTVQCDMVTDGGGWMLVTNYLHRGGTNPPLNIRTTNLPLQGSIVLGGDESGTATWGHASNSLMAAIAFDETMWYGATSAHGRVIHFKNSSPAVRAYIQTGTGSMRTGIRDPQYSTGLDLRNVSTLPLHGAPNDRNGFVNQGNLAMTNFPFYGNSAIENPRAHWGIGGLGNRWEVDDPCGSFCGETQANSTLHQVWVRRNPCNDGLADFDETGVDCGGSCGDNCGAGVACSDDGDCQSGNCATGFCDNSTLARTCNTLLASSPGIDDGVYLLDPDGAGGAAPLLAECDMTFAGGGWTLATSTSYGRSPNQSLAGSVFLGSTNHMPPASMTAVANLSTQTHLRTHDTESRSITSAAGSTPIVRLRAQRLLDGAPGWDGPGVWSGPLATPSYLNFSCGVGANDIYPNVYWACGNGAGLHLLTSASRWRFSVPGLGGLNEPMELWVR